MSCWLSRTKLVMSNAAPASNVTDNATCAPIKNLAEALLLRAAARSAAAFLQAVDQIRARTLQRRINSHRQAGKNRQHDREAEHAERKLDARIGIERQKVRRHFWHHRNELPGQQRARDPGE